MKSYQPSNVSGNLSSVFSVSGGGYLWGIVCIKLFHTCKTPRPTQGANSVKYDQHDEYSEPVEMWKSGKGAMYPGAYPAIHPVERAVPC